MSFQEKYRKIDLCDLLRFCDSVGQQVDALMLSIPCYPAERLFSRIRLVDLWDSTKPTRSNSSSENREIIKPTPQTNGRKPASVQDHKSHCGLLSDDSVFQPEVINCSLT